jgi:Protein of unknown function (DUF2997).
MSKITALISKKSGKVQLSVEGVVGESCKELTRPLEEGLGMKEPERELKAEFYQQVEQQQTTGNQ